MIRPGPRNLITDVSGIRVGNAEDPAAHTGSTVLLPDERAVAAVDVRGGAPGTRETELLRADNKVDRVDAIVLSGGSVFGLAAGDGVVSWLAERKRGFAVGAWRMPIVPGAILFDMASGGDKNWGADPPYRELGRRAADNAATDFALGNVGAGLGARAGNLKGGLGSASAIDDDGLAVGALIAANPTGSVVMPGCDAFWAWPLEQNGEFGGRRPPAGYGPAELEMPSEARLQAHTTIGAVAVNAELSKAEAKRVAVMAHDGLARAIRPVHTPFDGDCLFVVATGARPPRAAAEGEIARIGMIAADCVARAVARAVYAAEDLGEIPSYRTVHAG